MTNDCRTANERKKDRLLIKQDSLAGVKNLEIRLISKLHPSARKRNTIKRFKIVREIKTTRRRNACPRIFFTSGRYAQQRHRQTDSPLPAVINVRKADAALDCE